MAKAQYVGIGGVCRKVKAPYMGIGGVARSVIAGFVGIAGVARQFLGRGVRTLWAGYDTEGYTFNEIYYDDGDTLGSGYTGVSGTVWLEDVRSVDLFDADDDYIATLNVPDISISFSYDGDPLGRSISGTLPRGVLDDILDLNPNMGLRIDSGEFYFVMHEHYVYVHISLSGKVESRDMVFRDVPLNGDGAYTTGRFTLYTD